MGNTNDAETKKETEEEHFSESCCIQPKGTANGAHKFARKCFCPRNLPTEVFYHHSSLCSYLAQMAIGRYIIKMICWCGGPYRSYSR